MDQHLSPIDLSPPAREFLFACAYWIMAADGALKGIEQDWLAVQFGTEETYRLLHRYVRLSGDEFFKAFDGAAAELSDADRRSVYPPLRRWLSSGVTADGKLDREEMDVLNTIARRLNLDEELERLSAESPAPPSPPPVEAAPPAILEEPVPTPAPAPEVPPPAPAETTVTPLEGHTDEVSTVAIHPQSRIALSGSQDRTVRLWEIASARQVLQTDIHKAAVTAVAWTADGKRFVSADRAGLAACCAADTGKVIWQADLGRIGGVSSLAVHPAGDRIAASSPGATIVTLDAKTGTVLQTWRRKGWCAFRAIRYTPDGEHLAAAGDDRTVRLLDSSTGSEVSVFAGHRGTVLALAFTADSAYMVTGARDNTVRVWDTAECAEVRRFFGHSFSVHGVDIEAEAGWMISAAWDHTAKLWDPGSGRALLNYDHQEGRFNAVACAPHSPTAVLACSDHNLYVVRFAL